MATPEDFAKAVDDGLKLAKRVYFGKDRAVSPPKPPPPMDKSSPAAYSYLLPTAPMVYAVIYDPAIVDNPDVPSYQPHVHGRCDPPALIPLQMNRIHLEADCVLDTAFITVHGSWRVHCVMGSRSCDCRIAVPMGEQVRFLIEVWLLRLVVNSRCVLGLCNSCSLGFLVSTYDVDIGEKLWREREVLVKRFGNLLFWRPFKRLFCLISL